MNTNTQLDRDHRAAVEFFLWDPWSRLHALYAHTADSLGQCDARCPSWPCVTYRLAEFADQIHRDRMAADTLPIPRIPPDQL